jgi:hypothetical protein
VLLLHELLGLLALTDSLKAVAVVCKLHHNALPVMETKTYQSELEFSSKKASL